MRQLLSILLIGSILLFLFGCSYSDEIPHIEYKKGDCWVCNFRNGNFPGKTFYKDKIYCSSLEISSGKPNYFYCLNLKTGKVDWASMVDSWVGESPIVTDSFIYYSSYLGDLYKFDLNGNQVWKAKAPGSYAAHSLNVHNNNLLVNTVTDGIFEYDCQSGQVVSHMGASSLGAPLPVFYKDLAVFAGLNADTPYVNEGTGAICKRSGNKEVIWKKDLGNISGYKLFTNSGRLYFFESWKLNCLDITTGAQIWQSDSLKKYGGMVLNPHLVFNNGLVMYSDTDMDQWIEFNGQDGSVLGVSDYLKLLSENKLKVRRFQYQVADTKNNSTYFVMVTDSLDYGRAFSIEIRE